MSSSLSVVFPHQLFADHPALTKQRPVVAVEDSLFFGDPKWPLRFHKQKLLLHRASMKAFADQLIAKGYRVKYMDYDPKHTIVDLIEQWGKSGIKEIHVVDPVDDVLERRLRRATDKCGLNLVSYPPPMFLTPQDWGRKALGARKPFRMASFYIAQRKRMGLLMRDGEPEGGQWSFDADNRKKWPKDRTPPSRPSSKPTRWVTDAGDYVESQFCNHPGQSDNFVYPVTHAGAKRWLSEFLEQRFRGFGDYEDAMVANEPVLHHSVLTPMLNTGLLTPAEIIEAVEDYAANVNVPLNDREGFIRQVIGWREFMMLTYREIGVKQRNANFWEHKRPMPASFYTGETGIDPVDRVIRRVLKDGYAHHIERLMVLGNFMLLCEIHPDDVYAWFMELFIDAYDWVMVPNVYGMSQFADGGLLCTKPYISGSNYIRKMSDFKPGPWCAIWDGLFWRFIDTHRAFFEKQPRLSMMARQLDRMKPEKLKEHRRVAEAFLAGLG